MGLSIRKLGKRKVVTCSAFLALSAASVLGFAVAGPEDSAPARLLQQTSSALEEFLARSPGERDDTLLSKGKGKGKGKSGLMASREVPVGEPEQEALGKVFESLVGPPDVLPDAIPFVEPDLIALNDAPDVLSPGGFVPFGPGGGGGGLIGGGGGGGGGNPGGPTPPAGPIPEPSTWALLLLGFFFTGSALRRKNDLSKTVVHA